MGCGIFEDIFPLQTSSIILVRGSHTPTPSNRSTNEKEFTPLPNLHPLAQSPQTISLSPQTNLLTNSTPQADDQPSSLSPQPDQVSENQPSSGDLPIALVGLPDPDSGPCLSISAHGPPTLTKPYSNPLFSSVPSNSFPPRPTALDTSSPGPISTTTLVSFPVSS